MTVALKQLSSALELLLEPQKFKDYCPNGLQIEGKPEINTLVSGVTACEALIDLAIEKEADAILVHHGYFWRGENSRITGIKKRRLKKLLLHDISLLAYHLPLDCHPKLGNNAQLAELLGIRVTKGLDPLSKQSIGLQGTLGKPVSGAEFALQISKVLGREPLYVGGDPSCLVQTIGWCTGSAQGYIDLAVEQGLDAYLTGEVSEQTVHIARETGIHFFSAGHHATERYGVQALGEWVANEFNIEHHFVDVANPV